MFGQPSVSRSAGITAAATIVLAVAGVAFAIRGGTASNNYIDTKKEVIVCTATGGLAKYAYCNWQEPVSDAGSGSIITAITYENGPSPLVVGVDWTIGASATASGATAVQNLTNVATASGKTTVYLTGALLIGSGNYLRGVTLTNPTASHRASVLIEYTTRLSKQ